jgi:hypothetical protein
MSTKRNAGVRVVTEAGAHAALRRAPATELSPEEDQVMRMRLGAAPPRTAPLERSYDADSDLEIEIRAAEIEAWMRWKAHRAAQAATRVRVEPARVQPAPSRAKEKIVRALRRKQ